MAMLWLCPQRAVPAGQVWLWHRLLKAFQVILICSQEQGPPSEESRCRLTHRVGMVSETHHHVTGQAGWELGL